MARIPQFGTAEIGNFAPPPETVPPALGALMFNMERGVHLAEIGEFLRDCPAVQPFDLILANELDDGCARSGNRNTLTAKSASGAAWPYSPSWMWAGVPWGPCPSIWRTAPTARAAASRWRPS